MSAILCALVLTASVAPSASPASPVPTAMSTSQAPDYGAIVDGLAQRTSRLPRDRRGMIVPLLVRLGPAAVPAMLARLSQESPMMAKVRAADPDAARFFREALTDALGRDRDARALPLLTEIFFSGSSDHRLVRAAAQGLGRLCDQGSFETLASHLADAGDLALAAISGLGQCREERSVALLAARLANTSDPMAMKDIADALGQAASSWAWVAMGPTRADEGARARHLAAEALLGAYVRAPALARETIAESLVMTDDPSVPAALTDQRFAAIAPLWRRAHLR